MIEVYSKPNCPYCTKAKQLLSTMNIPYNEYKLDEDFTREIILDKFPLAKSYPIVVVDGFHIGGYSQLVEKINSENTDSRKLLNG
jgi:glutaredoxin